MGTGRDALPLYNLSYVGSPELLAGTTLDVLCD